MRKNSFVKKLDDKDPEDESLRKTDRTRRRGGYDDKRSSRKIREKSKSRISNRWESDRELPPRRKYDFDDSKYKSSKSKDMPRVY